ncbi:pre-peptidase C-terminal domain-containing protein [Polyangium sorediatum]|uniref:Pre-peptidase C-terminal domain-containing protein n=1 Tax=Polyangium sorediatum TaxID=889274 RepID=A0ABT6P1L1_9BACT|nr:pre-peptidase C-terminal domain-containing protein [Polyangium sorediatum]MDI1434482.1 pre-peptidase C-terminal domain-containing protein [Polyangium sorediatum]
MKANAMSLVVVAGMSAFSAHAAPLPGAPVTVVGTAAGTARASNRSSGCPGYIVDENDYEFSLDMARSSLRLRTESSKDLVLVVQLPDGSYRCDDDNGGNGQPLIEITSPQLGTYRVWVGVWNIGVVADYRLIMSSDT